MTYTDRMRKLLVVSFLTSLQTQLPDRPELPNEPCIFSRQHADLAVEDHAGWSDSLQMHTLLRW